MFLRIIEFLEKVTLKLIEKLNITTVMIILGVFGYMQKDEVIEWFTIISKSMNI